MGQHWASYKSNFKYRAVFLSLMAALVVLATVWFFLQQHQSSKLQDQLNAETTRITTKIDERLTAYNLILRGATGLFQASDNVTRRDWQHYINALQLDRTYPGILAIGFARYLKPGAVAHHEAEVQKEGFPDYRVRPTGKRDEFSSIVFIEPFSGPNLRAFGYDMFSEPLRHTAMGRARDSAAIAYTNRITLIQDAENDSQSGIIAYLPVYRGGADPVDVNARRAQLAGWVYAPFRLSDLFQAMLGDDLRLLRLEVFDGTEINVDQLLYDSHPGTKPDRSLPQAITHHVSGGQAWTLRYTPLPGFESDIHFREVWAVRVAILLIAFLLLGISGEFLKACKLADTLNESEVQYRILADSGSALVWTSDTSKGCNYFNRRWLEFTGRPLEKEVGAGWTEGVHPEDLALCMSTYEQAFDRRDNFSMVYRLRRHDGEYRWFVDDGTPRYDSRGNFLGYIGYCLDITEYKLVTDELRASQERYSLLAEVSLVGIYHTDAQAQCLYVNERWCELSGIPLEQALGEGWREAIHPEDRARVAREWKKAIGDGQQLELEYRLQRPDGSITWVFGQAAAVRGDQDQPLGYVGTVTDITQLKEAEAKIRSLAFYDTLTDLPNRRLLMDRLSQALAVSRRNSQYGALLFIDLDNFKTLNDTQGHDMGDRLLVEVGARLRSTIRAGDTVARLGGDEFVVMLEDLGEEAPDAANLAESVAEKIQAALKKPYALRPEDNADYYNTPSIGVSLFQGEEASVDSLLKQADMALYQAKGAGRNTIRFFSPEMQATLEARTALEVGLRQALRDKEFTLHYQPQIDRSRRIVGAEALLRWQPAHGQMIPVAGFIPVAEETGLILPLGQWVLETACQQLKTWEPDPHLGQLQVSVNISPRQFRQPDFVDQVLDTIHRYGTNPSKLKIELTESVVLDDVDDTINKMRELKRMGIGFSLDDFGTGYSSLSYLKRLPLDQLKIDRSFVMDIETDDNDAAICAAIIALALNLGLQVVAEGVETNAQHYFLAVEHHCNLMQGYLFGKPMPAADLEAMVLGQYKPREV